MVGNCQVEAAQLLRAVYCFGDVVTDLFAAQLLFEIQATPELSGTAAGQFSINFQSQFPIS